MLLLNNKMNRKEIIETNKVIINERENKLTASESSLGRTIASSYRNVTITPRILVTDKNSASNPYTSGGNIRDKTGDIKIVIACAIIVPDINVRTFLRNEPF
jgi:hypothetical protein